MRPRLSLALTAALALPATAWPCDYVPQFVDGEPSRGATVTVNVRGFARVPFMARSDVTAELHHPEAFAPIPVDTRPLGDNVVELLFPAPLEVGTTYDAEVWLDELPDVRHRFRFTVEDRQDDRPPRAIDAVEFEAYSGPTSSCDSPGAHVRARFRSQWEADVVLYELVEYLPNDGQLVMGSVWRSAMEPIDEIEIYANVGAPADGRCFWVRAVDSSGNRSFTRQSFCFPTSTADAGQPPPPPPPIDAGFIDAGAADAGAAPDASPSPDAEPRGSAAGLASRGAGCGCSAAGSEPEGAAGFGLVLLGGLWGLRRARPGRAKGRRR